MDVVWVCWVMGYHTGGQVSGREQEVAQLEHAQQDIGHYGEEAASVPGEQEANVHPHGHRDRHHRIVLHCGGG